MDSGELNRGPAIRVLLEDDDSWVRRAMRALLSTDPGLEVVGEARDGEEALLLAEKLRPDVVLLDYGTPVADGLATTRGIKRRHLAKRIVVLTIDQTIGPQARECGADDVLLKGCAEEDLLDAIRRGSSVSLSGC